jgi:hypothetical protein
MRDKQSSEPIYLKIVNLVGIEVWNSQLEFRKAESVPVDLSFLKNGMYTLMVKSGSNLIYQKITIEK